MLAFTFVSFLQSKGKSVVLEQVNAALQEGDIVLGGRGEKTSKPKPAKVNQLPLESKKHKPTNTAFQEI
jgi:hypothetical protein